MVPSPIFNWVFGCGCLIELIDQKNRLISLNSRNLRSFSRLALIYFSMRGLLRHRDTTSSGYTSERSNAFVGSHFAHLLDMITDGQWSLSLWKLICVSLNIQKQLLLLYMNLIFIPLSTLRVFAMVFRPSLVWLSIVVPAAFRFWLCVRIWTAQPRFMTLIFHNFNILVII